MLCERCKIRGATIQYTEVVNGVRTEHNFCAQCASELDFGQYSTIFDSDFPLGKLLSGLLGVGGSSGDEKMNHVVCPACHTTYGEFVKNSRFGCPECYEVFDLLISEKIKQIQGSNSHKGKQPKYQPLMRYGHVVQQEDEAGQTGPESAEASGQMEKSSKAARLAVLNREREAAVAREDYEAAARLRDEIKALKAGEETDA